MGDRTPEPGSILSMPAAAAERLIRLDQRRRRPAVSLPAGPRDAARPELAPGAAPGGAGPALRPGNGGAGGRSAAPGTPVQEALPPEYTTQDVTAALQEAGSTFSALADEVERRLGKRLSANDLKILLTLYDHLALPAR